MTMQEISNLSYILGRLEGLACGCDGAVQSGILDTCEMLTELLDRQEADK